MRKFWLYTGRIWESRLVWTALFVGLAVAVWGLGRAFSVPAEESVDYRWTAIILIAIAGFVVGWGIWPRRSSNGWRPLAPWRDKAGD